MSSRPINYAKLTREQVNVLENKFENGMKSTTCSEIIQKTAEETSLPVEKIKLNYLESLGCDSSCLLVNERKEVFVLGSSEGKTFLNSEPAMICKFQSVFDVDYRNQGCTHEHVKQLFNLKYSEAKGVTGARVPYLSGGFRVEGLPEGIRLKKPRHYGSNEIKRIMANKEKIRFIIETDKEHETSSVGNKDYDELIEKVFGRKKFLGKVSKEDIQAITKEKFASVSAVEELVSSCQHLFSNDALDELRKSLNEFVSNAEDLILPVYCSGEEDKFWLLYCRNSARNVQGKGEEDKLTGYWLDHKSNTTYTLLDEKVTLIGENIIKNDGQFFFEVHKFDENKMFELNRWFEKKIINVLSEQGYI